MTTREVLFEGNPPWGFRMNGGADSGHQLRISRVNPGSKAESKGVREGDLITSINGQPTKCLSNSDSHALLRTVKENLRLGLNEDLNGSPRRRSKEIKSSPAVSEKSIASTPGDKENTKPSRSKQRRLRKKRLKEILKEKLLGYKETPGHVLTDQPVPEGALDGSSRECDGPERSAEDDNSSRKLYDNVGADEGVVDSSRINPSSSFIQEERVAVVVERDSVEKSEPQGKLMQGNVQNSNVPPVLNSNPSQNAVWVEIDHPKSPKTVSFLPQKAQIHAWEDKPSFGEAQPVSSIDCSQSEEKMAAEVVICSPNSRNSYERLDDIHEESKTFLPSNDLAEVLSSTKDDEENVYELVVSNMHDPLIAHEDEVKLRSYLGSLGLHQPSDISVQEARVCPPTEIPAYFLPPKRYLDVISEENSDVSEGDRPWENPEKIRQANALIDTIPEDWYGSQDGIDTSWRDGKSLEEMSDIPVVTDSHSDSDAVEEKRQIKTNDNDDRVLDSHRPESTPKPSSVVKNVVSSFFTSKQTLPVPIETLKNSATVQGPNSEVVEIVYLDSSDSEAISSSKSDCNLTPTPTLPLLPSTSISQNGRSVNVSTKPTFDSVSKDNDFSNKISDSETTQVKTAFGSDKTIVGSVSTNDLPKANTDVVEIVCIDSSDSEAVSARSSRNFDVFDLAKDPIPEEVIIGCPSQNPTSLCASKKMCESNITNSKSSADDSFGKSNVATEVITGKLAAQKSASSSPPKNSHKSNLPNSAKSCSKSDMAKISEMIDNITDSANEIISTSNEHLARLTPAASPSMRKGRKQLDYKIDLKERCSSVPLFEDENAIKPARSVCSDTGGDESDFPHFICYDSETSSQSTTKPLYSGIAPLRELSLNAVLRLPFRLSFLKELGFDQSEYDSYSGYMPEGSEYSFSSKQPLSEREYILEDSDNDNVSISGSLPPRSIPDFQSPPPSHKSDKWVGVQIPTDTKILVAVSPNQSKSIKCTQPNVVDLLDLHQKFVQRRGYHEPDDKFPVGKYDRHVSRKEEDSMIHEMSEFRALQEYHALRQKKMKSTKTRSEPELSKTSLKLSSLPYNTLDSPKNKGEYLGNDLKIQPGSAISKTGGEKEKVTGKGLSADPGSEGNEVVGNSRLLELIQRADFKGSSDSLNMSAAPYPYWLLLDQQTVSTGESVGKDVPKTEGEDKKEETQEVRKTEDGANADSENKGNCTNFASAFDNFDRIESNLFCVEKVGQKERPKSVPPSGERFRQKMYEEYMNKLAELSQRRRIKAIKLSDPKYVSTPSVAEFDSLRDEFMDKVRERMVKLGLTDDFVLVDSSMVKKPEEIPPEEPKKLPKHVQELMALSDDLGVWSPAQTPETERKTFDFSSVETREEKHSERSEEPTPAVWTPRSAGPSPTLGRKFRPVNFQSPPPQRRSVHNPKEGPELPKDLPPETTTSTTSSSSLSSSSRLISSTSENSTLTSTQLRLPSSQNPTITLLQKAREGQIPKGAQYLDDTAPDRSTGISPDEIIYSVKNEITTTDEDGVRKIVELSPKKFTGIGPTTRDGVPIGLRSEVNENNQQRWYKRMYDSLHKTADRDSQYPYSSYSGGYASEPERLGYDSDASVAKYATLDRRKIRNKDSDFTTSTLPRNRYAPAVKHAVNIYKNQPGRIEDYEPGNSSIAEIEKKQWWDEVLDIFDGELNSSSKDVYATPSRQSFTTYALKDTGYDSDSTLVFKRRENMSENLSPAEQKMAYKVVQRGGEVPLHGLRKAFPDRPKESPHRYVESEVNIHYKSPVRSEAKAAWPEDELAEKQAEIMRRIYQEQRRTKYLNELHDMYSRRHTDNLLPSQKSPIPLNRYDDFPLEPQPPRPRDRTPEPKLVARALYNFVGQTSRELSFRRGDIIYVRRQIDKNWYEGEHNAMIGLFPFNYVEIISYDGIRTLPKKANEGQARAKFNFQAQTHLELSLVKGELVLLTRRVDENWFEGRIGNRKGIFPVSYVEVLVEPGERTLSPSGPISTKPIVAPASHSVMLNGAKDIGQQHYQPPRPALYSSSSLPPHSKMGDIGMVSQSLHIDTQSDPVPYRVLYNYKPQNDDELELKEGDVVYVMEKCDDGWYVGSLHRNGQFGTFPGNYVERILQ